MSTRRANLIGMWVTKAQKHHIKTKARWPIRTIFDFWGSKVPKMGDSLPWTPMNHRAKIDAASFIVGGEIRNGTNKNKQTHKQ